jgi:hypothetical protein
MSAMPFIGAVAAWAFIVTTALAAFRTAIAPPNLTSSRGAMVNRKPPARAKHAHTAQLEALVEARRYLWRASFAPDPTVNASELLGDLVRLVESRLTAKELSEVNAKLNPAPWGRAPSTVSLP